ncbi:hypothetical protein B0H19DRAFT_1070914 [Mycena capillaripes]|nr:hypothetical protein B0H19DRAFT_1070914 [Mycena capillaripes]
MYRGAAQPQAARTEGKRGTKERKEENRGKPNESRTHPTPSLKHLPTSSGSSLTYIPTPRPSSSPWCRCCRGLLGGERIRYAESSALAEQGRGERKTYSSQANDNTSDNRYSTPNSHDSPPGRPYSLRCPLASRMSYRMGMKDGGRETRAVGGARANAAWKRGGGETSFPSSYAPSVLPPATCEEEARGRVRESLLTAGAQPPLPTSLSRRLPFPLLFPFPFPFAFPLPLPFPSFLSLLEHPPGHTYARRRIRSTPGPHPPPPLAPLASNAKSSGGPTTRWMNRFGALACTYSFVAAPR